MTCHFGGTIETTIGIVGAHVEKIILENVQQIGHLRKDQHLEIAVIWWVSNMVGEY